MKTKDILKITTVALGTTALTVMTFWSAPIDAGIEIEGAANKIAQPKLRCHGIELSVTHPDALAIKAGDCPTFELTALNTSTEPQTARVCVRLTGIAPTSPLSRTIAMPRVLWQQEQTLTLNAGEKRLVPLTVTTNLTPNELYSVLLAEVDTLAHNTSSLTPVMRSAELSPLSPNQIVAFSFSTIPAAARPVQIVTGIAANNKTTIKLQ